MALLFNSNFLKGLFGSKTGYYINAIEIAESPDEWIRIVPVGNFPNHHNGAHVITPEHIKQMAANFSASGTDLLFDIDHGSLGGPTKAAGWSSEVEAREDGLYAKYPNFTPSAKQSVVDREYRYFSPVYSMAKKNKQGEEIGAVIDSVAITNRPYMDIEIDAIGNRGNVNQKSKHNDMKLSKESLEKLGLKEDASQEQINEAIMNMAVPKGTEDEEPTPKKAAGDSEPSDGDAADDNAKDLQAKLNALQKRLDDKDAAESDHKAEAYVNSAVEQGKINPAEKATYITAAKADFAGISKILDARKANSALPGKVNVDASAGNDDNKKVNQNEACADFLRAQMKIAKTGS